MAGYSVAGVNAMTADAQRDRDMIDAIRQMLGFSPLYNDSCHEGRTDAGAMETSSGWLVSNGRTGTGIDAGTVDG
ncbi:hypothetical protein LCGC14_0754610 [marine sediment metagenome]|uniref:Uncharacterized protein n=1 Tax=marine sediment metagenome TaxID=412755 RepID=A0A0F9SN55_9ZZZZ